MQGNKNPSMEENKPEASSCSSGDTGTCDAEAPEPENAASNDGGQGDVSKMTPNQLKMQLMALLSNIKHEISTMDTEKAKQMGFRTKEKLLVYALALKALLLPYVEEIAKIDKAKAKELGAKYHGKAKDLGVKYRGKAVEGYNELKVMDRARAKEKSILLAKKARAMSPAQKIKYAILLGLFFFLFRFESSEAGNPYYGHTRTHPHLCYIEQRGKHGYTESCETMLADSVKDAKNWVLLGNEPMANLLQPMFPHVEKFNGKKPFVLRKSDGNSRNKNQHYFKYGRADEDEWILKYYEKDNPNELAVEFDTARCLKCSNRKFQDKLTFTTIEYLLLESSRDVFFTTNTTKTSQETILKYMSENYQDRSKTACVIQTGSYEMKAAPWRTTSEFMLNTDEFHKGMEDYCGTLIRIGMFQSPFDKSKHDDWDHGARDSLLDHARNGYFIDVGNIRNPSRDGTILPLLKMFTRLMGVDSYDYK